jgi:hypothetical protein
MSRMVPILGLCALLCACGPSEQPKPSSPVDKKIADLLGPLPSDPSRASAELGRRLAASIKVQDGLLTVHDPIMGEINSSILPVNSPWVINCGIGISIVFGTSVTGDSNGAQNDVEISLTNAVIDQKTCAIVGLRLAKKLQSMLAGE